MKHDGSLSFKGDITPLQKIILTRRSFRKYREGSPTAEQLETLGKISADFCDRMGFQAPRIVFVTGEERYRLVVSAACAGVIGKSNPWLPISKSRVMIVAGYDSSAAPTIGDRNLGVAQTAMAMEVVVLAATEMGLATCWMSGVNGAEVEKALEMPEGRRVIAISPLGLPPEGIKLLSWDGVAYHLMSKRRKPLSGIYFEEELPDERA